MRCLNILFLEMNRSWMYGDRRERAYLDGVLDFCESALNIVELPGSKQFIILIVIVIMLRGGLILRL